MNSKYRNALLAASADSAAEYVQANSLRARLLSRRRIARVSATWIESMWNATENGATDEEAREDADAIATEAMPIEVWLLIGQFVLKLLWAWWQKHHPPEVKGY